MNLRLDSISLLGEIGCPLKACWHDYSLLLHTSYLKHACGTTLMEDRAYVAYENKVTPSYERGIGPRGSLTKDKHIDVQVQCEYIGNDNGNTD